MVCSVLFVCSADDFREIYSNGLRQHGILPVSVSTVEHAEALLRQFQVATLIYYLDPDREDAAEECARLRAMQAPLIVLVGRVRTDQRHILAAQELAPAAVVTKPCTPAELARVVSQVVAGARGLIFPAKTEAGIRSA